MLARSIRYSVQHKRSEASLALAKNEAEEASRAKSEFLANMSHELRTPLTGIIGMNNLALEVSPTEEQREYLELVRYSADNLLGVINDLLDLSKAEAKKLELDSIRFNVCDSLGPILKPLANTAQEKGVHLRWRLHPDLPEFLIGDPNRLGQIIVNLVGNGVKFTHEGEVALRAELKSRTRDEVVLHFSVSDTGIGISAEKRRVIFDAFAQADSSHVREYGGTGLGLAICSQLVELMSGQIWVESEMGKGSTFHFTARFGLRADRDAADTEARPSQYPGLRFVLVEDQPVARKLTTRILEKRGHTVIPFSDTTAALEAAEREPFDLALVVAHLNGEDGLEATQRFRERERERGTHLPIIGLTAHVEKGLGVRCVEAGMDGFILKPIAAGQLDAAIEEVMRRHKPKLSPDAASQTSNNLRIGL